MTTSPIPRRARTIAACVSIWCTMVLLSGAFVAATDAGPCPPSEWSFVTAAGWNSAEAAAFDTSYGLDGSMSGGRVRFDFPAGEVGAYRCCGLGITAVKAIDAFDVMGVAPGTPVTAVLTMDVDGWILGAGCGASGCWGDLRATVRSGSSANQVLLTANIFAVDSVRVSGSVMLPITFVAGEPRTIELQLEAYRAAGGNNGAHGTGVFRFAGLPADVGVISCKGFAQQVVPARSPSWGRLKALYR